MATITSSILALLAAAPEPSGVQTAPGPAIVPATVPEDSPEQSIPVNTPDAAETGAEGSALGSAAADAPEPAVEDKEYRGGLDIDRYSAVETIDVRNIAGSSIPTSRPRAYPRGPSQGFIGQAFSRRARMPARGGGPTPPGKWEFSYHGFLRAPFRAGISERRPAYDAMAMTAPDATGQRADGQSKYSLHDPTVPDDQYLGYAYTKHTPRDWAELYLTYGNGIVAGTVSFQGFNFSDAAWKERDTQFGIAQAWVTLTPKVPVTWAKLMWKVGSFYNLYGMSGRYDQGEIETYLYGRTHTMGETLTADISLNPDFTLWLEHGVGTTRPDPQFYNGGRFTFQHHAHIGIQYQNKIEFNVHWISTSANEADRLLPANNSDIFPPDPDGYDHNGDLNVDLNPTYPAYPWANAGKGRMHVVGPELRIDWGRLGFIYAGFSYINAKNAQPVSRAIEVIHSMGGGQFRHGIDYMYLGLADSGQIFSVIGQVENSIQKIRLGSNWWGQGPDLVAKFYFMVNKVRTDVPDDAIVRPGSEDTSFPVGGADGDLKYKIGFDLLGMPLAWLGIGARVTHISPDSDFKEQRFTILSPRIRFRTNFLSHELIELQYSRYFYNQRTCPTVLSEACVQSPENPVQPTGFGSSMNTQNFEEMRGPVILKGQRPYAPDADVIMLLLTMWW